MYDGFDLNGQLDQLPHFAKKYPSLVLGENSKFLQLILSTLLLNPISNFRFEFLMKI